MKTKKVNGIVLGGYPFGDGHKVINFMSSEMGLIKVVAHKIKSQKSKFGSSLELFNIVNLLVGKARKSKSTDELFSIREHNLIHSYHKLREDYKSICILYHLSEFLTYLLQGENSLEEIFELTKNFLSIWEEKGNEVILSFSLQLKLLNMLGFINDFTICYICGGELSPEKSFISKQDAHIVCSKCSHKYDKMLKKDILVIMGKLIEKDFDFISRIKLNKQKEEEITFFLKTIIHSLFGKKLKSEMLKEN